MTKRFDSQLAEAMTHFKEGRLAEAGTIYLAVLAESPDQPEANYQMGRIAVAAAQTEAGLPYFVAALNADPENGRYWLDYIDALLLADRDDEARDVLTLARQHGLAGAEMEQLALRVGLSSTVETPQYDDRTHQPKSEEIEALFSLFRQGFHGEVVVKARALTRKFPQLVEAWQALGVALKLLGRNEEALEPLRKAAELSPSDAEAHYNLGVTLHEIGRLEEAETSYRQALRSDANYADALLNLGVVLYGQGVAEEAEKILRRAVEAMPANAKAHANLGIVLHDLGATTEAEACYRKALQLAPHEAEIHNRLAVLLQAQGRLDEADEHLRQALALAPKDPKLHGNRGNLLQHAGRLDEAAVSFREAVRLAPDDATQHFSLGYVLRKAGRLSEAEEAFKNALALKPDDFDGLNAMGNNLRDLGRLGEAEACYRRALQLSPDNPAALSNLGATLVNMGRADEADECLARARELLPEHAPIYSNHLHLLMLTDGAGYDADAIFREHVAFGERFEAPLRPLWQPHPQSRDPERRLKVGFVSPDFFDHSVSMFIEPMVAQLSEQPLLEIHAYYNNLINDAVTKRLRGHFKMWHDVANLSDAELAEQIRADRIDILIDLAGHTAEGRLLTFARKPAPVQASWIGYPGTTGLQAMDYYLADRFLLPAGRFDHHFVEKIVRLPANTPFQLHADAPPVTALPALDRGFLTFGSFNRPSKLNRETIALWAGLLRSLPNSRMLLGAMAEHGQYEDLAAWFAEERIDRERLSFHPRTGLIDYLSLHDQVDMCLDSFPYNGGTTTLQALWMGVPTLTIAGQSMRSRVGCAVLSRVGLQEFIVEHPDEFVPRGLYWAQHLNDLADLRRGMRARLEQAPLRRPEVLAAGLYLALRKMWRRWCANMPAESFEVTLDDINVERRDAR